MTHPGRKPPLQSEGLSASEALTENRQLDRDLKEDVPKYRKPAFNWDTQLEQPRLVTKRLKMSGC